MGTEVVTNIRLQVLEFDHRITTFYIQSTWLNADSTIYKLGKTSKIDSIVAQHMVYFDSVIYNHVVARKIRLTRRFCLFCLLNKQNKQANGISSQLMVGGYLVGSKQLL